MKKLFKFLLILFTIGIFVSCQKEEKTAINEYQDINFGIIEINNSNLKNDPIDFNCLENNIPVKAEIEIEGKGIFNPEVFYLGDKLYTQSIKIPVPENDTEIYTITKFVLLNSDNEITMAVPNIGANFSQYVSKPIEFTIEVEAFKKTEIDIEVLCFIPQIYEDFGFFWFNIDEIVIREHLFFGDFCIKDPNEYVGSLYENQSTGLQIDMPAIFKIKAYEFKEGDWFELPYSPFTNSNIESNWGVGSPVKVTYPDYLKRNQLFKFELWIYVAVENSFGYVYFHTWEFNDDERINDGGDGVVDFVLGSCVYSETDLLLPPYMNLPELANVNISHPGNVGYWDLIINDYGFDGDLIIGNQAGWCGDKFTTITQGNKVMNIYNSLYPNTWPENTSPLLTSEVINKINWLFNNLHYYNSVDYGQFPQLQGLTIGNQLTQEQGLIIQDAIWYIVHGNITPDGPDSQLSQLMANDANGKGDFIPLPGGWASILMFKDNDINKYQLIFTVVDP